MDFLVYLFSIILTMNVRGNFDSMKISVGKKSVTSKYWKY